MMDKILAALVLASCIGTLVSLALNLQTAQIWFISGMMFFAVARLIVVR